MASFQGDFLSYVASSAYPVLDGILSSLETPDVISTLIALDPIEIPNYLRYTDLMADIELRNEYLEIIMRDVVGIVLLGRSVPDHMERLIRPVEYWKRHGVWKHGRLGDPEPGVWRAVIREKPGPEVTFVTTSCYGIKTVEVAGAEKIKEAWEIMYPSPSGDIKEYRQFPYVDLLNEPLKVQYTVKERPGTGYYDMINVDSGAFRAYLPVPKR